MSTYKDKYIKYKKKYIDLKYRMTGGTTIKCPACTFLNPKTNFNCAICGYKLQEKKIEKINLEDYKQNLSILVKDLQKNKGDDGFYLYIIKKFITQTYDIVEKNLENNKEELMNIINRHKKNFNNSKFIKRITDLIMTLLKDKRKIITGYVKKSRKPKLVIHTLGLSNLDDKTFYGLWKEKIEPKILTKLLEHYDIKFIHYDKTFDKNFTRDNEEFKKDNFDIKKFEELKVKSPNETYLIINMAGSHVNNLIPFMHQNLFLDIPFIPDFSKIKNFDEFKLIDYSIEEKRIITVSEAMMKGTDGKYIDKHIKLILDDFEDNLKKTMNEIVPKILEGKEQKIRTEVFEKLDKKLKNLKHEIYHKIYIKWKNIDIAFSEIENEMNEFINKLI